jgi:transposase
MSELPTTPAKKPARYDPTPGTAVRGMKLPLYPQSDQSRLCDLWRQRCRSLWNLLLGMQMAAYSGEKYMAEVLDWRSIWLRVARVNYDLAVERRARRIAEGREPGKEPEMPDEAKILARGLTEEPKLFIWENDLQKLMALLKQEPATAWIGDIPSHAAQHVVKDLIKALQTMLRERKKRAAGTGDRMAGFPRFKPNRYAEGSVYFANTQLKWDTQRKRVKFPNGAGWVRYDGGDDLKVASLFAGVSVNEEGDRIPRSDDTQAGDGAKFMGARLWRQGERWWLSPQFELPVPAAPPLTGREIGLKVAAGTLATVYDGRRFQEFAGPKDDPRHQRRMKLWGRKLIRRREAETERKAAIARRTLAHKGPTKGKGRVRLRRSKGFHEASAELARRHGRESNQRNHTLHWVSHVIATGADHIAIEQMDVAGMMEKRSHRSKKREQRLLRRRAGGKAGNGLLLDAKSKRSDEPTEQIDHKAPAKVLRKAMRRAAVARLLGYIKYKAHDAGREVTETHELFPRVQQCANPKCHALHPVMKDGRAILRCPDCGGVMRRHLNAAENIYESGKASREAGLEAAE